MPDFPLTDAELLAFAAAGRGITDDEFDILFEYYLANDLIDYGTAKARTGDPYLHIEADLRKRAVALGWVDPRTEIVYGLGAGKAFQFIFEEMLEPRYRPAPDA